MTATRIETGTPRDDARGFSKDLFPGWLVREENPHCLHNIISREKNEGNTQNLIQP